MRAWRCPSRDRSQCSSRLGAIVFVGARAAHLPLFVTLLLTFLIVFFFFRFVDVVVSFQSCIGFTKKQDNQIKQTCYAQASQIRAVRKKMCDIMSEEAGKCDLRELVLKL